MKRILLTLFVLLLNLSVVHTLWAQNRTVTGKVTSMDDGTALPGVNVIVKGTTNGTTTNADGVYSLSDVPNDATLIFSFIGLETEEVVVGNRSVIDLKMVSDVRELGEIVVVGYGTQDKKQLTGSVASVNADQIRNIPIVGVDQALQGRAAGVQVTQNSGTPGSGIAVRVRGANSISAGSEPLYVIDGVPINTGNYSGIGVGNQQINALSDINPSDIASIEVLKDAAAAAIYGSRAGNGVVLITTKRGANQKTQLNFGYYTGIQEPWKKLEVLTGPEFEALVNEQRVNAGLAARYPNPENAANTNWQDEIFRRAPISNYELSASGGDNKTKFLISGTYFDQKGTIIGSGYNRLSTRFNLDHNLSEKLRFGTSLGLSRSKNTRIQNDNNIYGVLSAAVLMGTHIPVYNEDGSYGRDPFSSVENPVAAAKEPFHEAVNSRVIGSAFAEYEFVPGLVFRTQFGLDFLNMKEDQFIPNNTNQGAGSNGLGRSDLRQDLNWLNENTLNYTRTFGENHSFNGLLGMSFQQSNFESITTEANNFPGNDIRRLSAGSVKADASSNGAVWALTSFFSRFNYAFKGKYLASAAIRTDGSSRFGANNRYGVFPAGSLGWRIAEEGFMDNLNFISELKLRASYGLTGNSEIGTINNRFPARGLYGVGISTVVQGLATRANYLQNAGLVPTQLENPDLRWEKTRELNIGLDLGVFQDRLSLSANYFIRTTTDLLLDRPLQLTSGFRTISENIGSIENRGLEFDLRSVNIDNNNFTWSTNFNIAFIRNKVLSLYNDAPFASGFASWVAVGQPLGSFYGYVVDGIFRTPEDLAAGPIHSSATKLGDIRFKDISEDGRITADDQQIIGSAQPDFYGGLTNTFAYKGFDLNIFFQFVYGNQIYNNTRAFAEGMNGQFGQLATVRNRWTPENPNSDMPRAVQGDPSNNRRVSDRWIEDGSFLRLKNVVLGYTLPRSVVDAVRLRNVRVYASSQNLLTFTNYSGLDPEVNTFSGSNTSLGTDFLVFPQARTYTIGVNIGL